MTTDQELIARVVTGDAMAAGQFVDRFSRLIWSILTRDMQLLREDAEEIYQEVFSHLWEDRYRRLRQWKGKGKFSSYLVILVFRLAYDVLRKSKAKLGHHYNPPGANPGSSGSLDTRLEEGALAREQRDVTLQILKTLSGRDREIIERRHYQGQSYAAIARAMDMTVRHVGVALCRAEKRLRRGLREKYPGLFDEEKTKV